MSALAVLSVARKRVSLVRKPRSIDEIDIVVEKDTRVTQEEPGARDQ